MWSCARRLRSPASWSPATIEVRRTSDTRIAGRTFAGGSTLGYVSGSTSAVALRESAEHPGPPLFPLSAGVTSLGQARMLTRHVHHACQETL